MHRKMAIFRSTLTTQTPSSRIMSIMICLGILLHFTNMWTARLQTTSSRISTISSLRILPFWAPVSIRVWSFHESNGEALHVFAYWMQLSSTTMNSNRGLYLWTTVILLFLSLCQFFEGQSIDVVGCMDTTSLNYNPEATVHDVDSCRYPCFGGSSFILLRRIGGLLGNVFVTKQIDLEMFLDPNFRFWTFLSKASIGTCFYLWPDEIS